MRHVIALGILICSCGRSETATQVAPGLVATAASVSLVPSGDSVISSLTIKNAGTTTQTVQFAPCSYLGPLTLRAYVAGPSKLVWDSGLDNSGPCFLAVERIDLAPGAAHTFQQVNDVNEILGDSLAAGSYALTVSGRNLVPAVPTEIGITTLSLAKYAVPAATYAFTTDSAVYSATASGTEPVIFYSFTVIARYVNTGSTPIMLLNECGPHPSWEIFGAGDNVGVAAYNTGSGCLVPTAPVVLASGAARMDTIQFRGPVETAQDGTPLGPLSGQFRITYRAGAACNTSTFTSTSSPCVTQVSNVFAVRLPQ